MKPVLLAALLFASAASAVEPAPGPATVREAQQQLASHGQDAGPTDGRWGRKTEVAVKSFQQKQGLEPTGRLDGKTLAALGVIGEDVSASTGGSAPASSEAPTPNYLKR
jgi:peptidoglycan hydrolase-like protein with peptidoglycan-binding domain